MCQELYLVSYINIHLYFISTDIKSPSVMDFNSTSITLQWNEIPPVLTGSPQRSITQYAVTLTPQDDEETDVVFVPAEANVVHMFTSLRPNTTYIIKTGMVIDTVIKGQVEQTYDIGVPLLIITTGWFRNTWARIYSKWRLSYNT